MKMMKHKIKIIQIIMDKVFSYLTNLYQKKYFYFHLSFINIPRLPQIGSRLSFQILCGEHRLVETKNPTDVGLDVIKDIFSGTYTARIKTKGSNILAI